MMQKCLLVTLAIGAALAVRQQKAEAYCYDCFSISRCQGALYGEQQCSVQCDENGCECISWGVCDFR